MWLMNMGMLAISAGAPILASAAAASFVVLAVFGSNRIQRQINGSLARLLSRVQSERTRHMTQVLARLDRVRDQEELFEELPWITSHAVGVSPVTLFRLDGERFTATGSTRPSVNPDPVWPDEPLALMLKRGDGVHYLIGRTDDLQNAPIHAVNGQQVEACDAICAIPLKRDGKLVAFLLCGPPADASGPDLTLMGVLESLGGQFAAALERLPVVERSEDASSAAPMDEGAIRIVVPEPLDRRLSPVRRAVVLAAQSEEAEPQLVGNRGGFETRD
jgi:hypothetical protein